jgi:hypothetical protein
MSTLLQLLELTGLGPVLAVQIFFPLASVLWILVELAVFRVLNRGGVWRSKLISGGILVIMSLSAFPMSWFAFMASFATSWPLLWASAIVFIIGGTLGLFALVRLAFTSNPGFS